MNKIMHYLKVYRTYVKLAFVKEMQFRFNFLLWFFVIAIDFIIYLLFYNSMYGDVGTIAGWSKYEWFFYLGYQHVLLALFMGLFISVIDLYRKVNTGELDFILLKPLNPQFAVSLSNFHIGYFINIIPGVGLMIYSSGFLNMSISPMKLLGIFVYTAVGIMILYSIILIVSTISIWVKRTNFVSPFFIQLMDFMRIPSSTFGPVSRFIFTYVLPILLVCAAPVGIAINKISVESLVMSVVMGLVWFIVSSIFWRFAIKFYSGASS